MALERAGHGVMGAGPQSKVGDRATGDSKKRLERRPNVGGQKTHGAVLNRWQ